MHMAINQALLGASTTAALVTVGISKIEAHCPYLALTVSENREEGILSQREK